MELKRPIGIDLFAGAGGMSLGFEQAGFDIVAAVEVDPVHCAVHKFNFPTTAVLPKTVVGLNAKEIRLAAGIGKQRVDCVFGGPPCQGFSMMGQRILDDPRNQLVKEFVRLVSELDARTFVFENVKGLTVGKHRQFLGELVELFRASGYQVRLPWHVLNAANYGVPQHRHRLILLGAKNGETLPEYPGATYCAADKPQTELGLPIGPTAEDAIGDIPDADTYKSLIGSDEVSTSKFSKPSKYAAELRCKDSSSWHYSYRRRWDPTVLTSSARTDHTEISRRRFSETQPGRVEPISRFFKLSPSGLSNTLRAGTDGSRGAFTSPRPIHYKFNRCITVREMARLHGFPDWFRFHATKWHGARQIGNSVPPPMARAIAQQLVLSLGIEPVRPTTLVELGDPGLLTMEMSKAAAAFGVDAPSSKRDKKSGAKKRKQIDIEEERSLKGAHHG